MKNNKVVLISLCLLISAFSCMGQRLEFGLSGGACYALGDINPGKHFLESSYTGGIYYRHNFSRRIALKAAVNYANFHSADEKTKEDLVRNAWFKSNILDISVMCEINFLPFFIGAGQYFWTPYLTGGFSAAIPLNMQGGFLDDTYTFDKKGLTTPNGERIEKKGIISPNLAIGFGFKFSLSKKIGMHIEWVINKTFVDWLDGIYYYNNENIFRENDILYICNTTNKDWYSMLQLGFSYKFSLPDKKRCIEHLDNF